MPTTVKELIEYLQTIPLDAELRVVVTEDCGYSQCSRFVPMELDQYKGNIEYTNMANNQFVEKHSELWDRRFLDFGET